MLITAQRPELARRAEGAQRDGRCLRKIRIVTAAGEAFVENVGLPYKTSLCSLWAAVFLSGIPFLQLKQWGEEIFSDPQHWGRQG